MKKSNETTTNVFVEKATEMYENKESKTRKEAVRAYFKSYDKILSALWNGLKAEEESNKAINAVIAGIAGGEGLTPAVWLVKHFSKYVDINGHPCTIRKDKDGNKYFAKSDLSGVSARGLLQRAVLNFIESARQGNRFEQKVVEPIK